MLIPHGSDAPRSIAFTERALHVATWLGVVVALVAMIGLGTIIARVGRLGTRSARAATLHSAPSSDLAALRDGVSRLNDVLDTIRRADVTLSVAAGITTADTAQLFERFLSHIPLPGLRRGAPSTSLPLPGSAPTLDPLAAQVELQRSRIVADSLLDHASKVSERMGSLADSATKSARASRGPRKRAPR